MWLTQFIFVKYMKIQDKFSHFKMSDILLDTTSYLPSWVQFSPVREMSEICKIWCFSPCNLLFFLSLNFPFESRLSTFLSLSDSPLFVGFSVLIADSPLLAHTCWIPQLSPHRLVPGLLPAAADHTLAAACCLLPACMAVGRSAQLAACLSAAVVVYVCTLVSAGHLGTNRVQVISQQGCQALQIRS